MTRYITKAAFIDYGFDGTQATVTADVVWEADGGPIRTGLLNAQGEPLYRVLERVPLGFHAKPSVRVKARRRK